VNIGETNNNKEFIKQFKSITLDTLLRLDLDRLFEATWPRLENLHHTFDYESVFCVSK